MLCNSIEGGKMLPKSFEELKVSGGGNRSSEITQLHLQVRRETRGRGQSAVDCR